MNKTTIEWTDYTSNLIKYRDPEGRTGMAASGPPGCANCYASAWSARLTGERDGAFTAKRQATLTISSTIGGATHPAGTRVTGGSGCSWAT